MSETVGKGPLSDDSSVEVKEVLQKMDELRKNSAKSREDGDKKERSGDTDSARGHWRQASYMNLQALEKAESYSRFGALRGENSDWKVDAESAVSVDEQKFVQTYCDTLGRQGGLYRRLKCVQKGEEYYRCGHLIEKVCKYWGFENSYCTMNYISIRMEAKQVSASLGGEEFRSSNQYRNIKNEINDARAMIIDQMGNEARGSDAWAKADYALAILLSTDAPESDDTVSALYHDYVHKAEAHDIESTRRILRALRDALATMEDPVAIRVESGIRVLEHHARCAQKILEPVRTVGDI